MGWCALACLCSRRLCGARPLLLLLMHLVEWLAYYVVLIPVDRRTSYNVLRLWNRRELGRFRLGVHACRVLASVWAARILVVGGNRIAQARQSGGKDIVVGEGLLRSLLLERAGKRLGVGYGCGLEFFEGLEIALALLALQLQERNGGAEGDGIWVVRL